MSSIHIRCHELQAWCQAELVNRFLALFSAMGTAILVLGYQPIINDFDSDLEPNTSGLVSN